jgi:hypothetical protein
LEFSGFLRCEEAGVGGFAAEGAIKGDNRELGSGGKGAEIRISPVFGGGVAEAGQSTENMLQAARLVQA